jgi:hypothetical protein
MTPSADHKSSSNSWGNVPSDKRQLSALVDMDSPKAVHEEALQILSLFSPSFDMEPVQRVFRFTVDLYEGRLPGYKACNTDYHNLHHITDTYLAMVRLLHGAQLSAEDFSEREVVLGIIGALLHDSGMIQESWDTEGTGAKYTIEHVQLSMDFVAKHAAALHLSAHEISDLRDMILCTDLMAEIPAISFSSSRIELLGKILATADLIAQMADRTYLEKLLFLYHEFREANVGNFKNAIDFYQQTINFFELSLMRFKVTLDNTSRYMVPHFKSRWNLEENLYILSLENQRKFLKNILADKNKSVYKELKRGNIIQLVRRKYGKIGPEDK